ncbi:MAG: hypothetical protein K2Q18_13640, partial [Bdellovibrionales bacterium]|nr:hypothetical protein [Bdellovibrionales bacterium]
MKTIISLVLLFLVVGNTHASIPRDVLNACGSLSTDTNVRKECLKSSASAEVIFACKASTTNEELKKECLSSQLP